MWVRPLFEKRSKYGAYNLLMAELRTSDDAIYQYHGFTRLTITGQGWFIPLSPPYTSRREAGIDASLPSNG